jgi:hypothetical protein
MDTSYLCHAAGVELRTCARCRRPVCRGCALRWHEWPGLGGQITTVAECRPCVVADARRIIAEARESLLADGIEPGF